ncbi:MAG: 1-acyl-sn-glycerol-3-phosphate acyltransferase [Persicimonas sp.]
MAILYTSLRYILRLAADLYFTDIEVAGRANVPEKGPVLFAANHPNSLMDAIILGAKVDRQIHYMAKSELFDNPLVALLFDRCGVIPVYKSTRTKGGGNEEAFRSAFQVLAEGNCLGIFPEGQNSPERKVLRVKTGAARIALGAERANDYELGVQIVPVGLNFENRDRFISRVLVRFGEPIEARDFSETHREDEQRAVRELTDELSSRLRDQVVHIEGDRVRTLVEQIYEVYGTKLLEEAVSETVGTAELPDDELAAFEEVEPLEIGQEEASAPGDETANDGGSRGLRRWMWDAMRLADRSEGELEAKLAVQQRIAEALDYYEEHDPRLVNRLQLRLWRYVDHVRQVRLKHHVLERAAEESSRIIEGLKLTAYAIAFSPIAAWGFVHNVVPYQVSRLAAKKAPDDAMRAFTALAVGLFIFPICYALYATGLWRSSGGSIWVTMAYLLSLPPAGYFFLHYRSRVVRYRHRILVRTLFRNEQLLVEDLIDERERLLETFDEMRDRYRTARADEADQVA